MRQEIELNKSQERNLNKVRKKAQKHQEQREPVLHEEGRKPVEMPIEASLQKTEEVPKEKKSLKELLHINQDTEAKEKKEKRFDLKKLIPTLPKKKETLPVQPVNEESKKNASTSMQEFFEPISPLNIKEDNTMTKEIIDKAKTEEPLNAEPVSEKKKLDIGNKLKVFFGRIKLPEKKEKQAEITGSIVEQPIANETKTVQNASAEPAGEKKKEVSFKFLKSAENKEKKEASKFFNFKNKDKEEKKEKTEKNPRPKAKGITFAMAILTCIVLFLGICGAVGAFVFAYKLCEDKPTLDVKDLVSPDSTTVFDNEGNKIMELGMYLRENIEYQDMPNCLIDAFLAIEDSRFFEHFGFDIPRFTKAAIENFKTRDFSQGGSTVTMQLIKNSYYSIDADDQSTIAEREGMGGIKRKMQEIVLALELELRTDVTKQEIIAMYINKVNYGNNIRGVQKAAQYYFGKDAKNLSLTESAFLAGLINSPNTYNPYNDLYKNDNYYLDPDSEYLKAGTARRNEVIDLMLMHGYITEAEADLAKSVRLEDLLVGVDVSFTEMNEKYQAYIDAVIDEVIESTGESPYDTGMQIYTNMNAYMQEYIYDMQNEADYIGITFPNKLCQSAIVVMDNQNGSVEALGGGRGEQDSARQFNRATSAYLNPGSSFKPIVDYALCLEALGYATSHTFTDMPYYLYGGSVLISNYDHQYYGDMLMTEALGRSQNTPAVQALAAVVEEKGEEYVIDYLNSIGFKFDYSDFDLQFAIGGNRCTVTPLQLAAAHAMFMNGGRYIKPHTINYIVYNDGRGNFVADTQGVQRLSKETAWMMAYLEEYNMSGSFSSLMWYCKRYVDYPLYGKTGTTDWGNSGRDYGIPTGATKDSWLVMQTNKYTISCWTGYDQLEKGAYFSTAEYQANTKSKIVTKILNELETHYTGEYDPHTPLEKPDSVVSITHVKGAYPYAYSNGSYATVTGWISEKALEEQPLVSPSTAYAYGTSFKKYISGGIANLGGTFDGKDVNVVFGTGAGENGTCTGESCDLSTTNIYGQTTYAAGRIWFPHWTAIYSGAASPPYLYTVTMDTGEVISGATNDTSIHESTSGGSKAKVCVSPSSGGSQACVTLNAIAQ